MPIYRYTPEGFVAEIHDGYATWVTGDYFYGVVGGQLRGSGVQSSYNIYAEAAPLALLQTIPAPPNPATAGIDLGALARAVCDEESRRLSS